MKIGIIGSGNIGGTLARAWVAAGHEVLLAYSRDPQRLRAAAEELGPSAQAGSPLDAATFGEVVVLSVPWPRVPDALDAAGDLTGRVLVDTTNPFASPGGPVDLPAGAVSAAQGVGRRAPGARVVKAFNTLYWETLRERVGSALAIPVSGDDPADKAVVTGLVRDAGFEPVDVVRLMRWWAGRLVEDFVADINCDWPWLVAPAYPDGVGRTGPA